MLYLGCLNNYTFHINLYDLAFTGAIFTGLTFAVLLWFAKTINRSANRFLALALVTMILWMARLLAIDIKLETYLPNWDWVPLQFLLALGPLMYFYVLKITRPQFKLRGKSLMHLSPLLLEQVVLALEIRESNRTGAVTWATHTFQHLNPVLQLLIFISNITYLHLCNGLIQGFYRRLQPVLMDRPLVEFSWLRRLLAATALLWFLWLLCACVDFFGYGHPPGIHVYYPFYIFFAVIIIWTAAAAFLKPQAAVTAQTAITPKTPVPGELKAKGAWLKKAMEANLYYQDPELSLTSLAEKLSLPPHELSRVINTVFKKGFNDFINEYRVREVISKMGNQAYDNMTLLGIAFDAGFNSQSTFSRIFKQLTGKSPAEFKKGQKKEFSSHNLGNPPQSARVISYQQAITKWPEMKLNRNYMFRNYVKIAWRNLSRNKASSLINVSGLAVGMAVAMLIGLWIWSELAFDAGFKNRGRIAKVMENAVVNNETQTFGGAALPLAPALRSAFGSDFKHVIITSHTEDHPLTYDSKTVIQQGNFMEPAITDMLSIKMVEGSAASLNDPSCVLLSQTAAKAVFGSANPYGKVIMIDKEMNAKVAGIYEDLPKNSSFGNLLFIAPWQMLANYQHYATKFNNPWGASWFQTFVQIADNTDMEQVSAKIKNLKLNVLNKAHNSDARFKSALFLHPMNRWYLYSDFKNGVNTGGRIQYILLFGLIGLFVLLLACINFMNLSTARSEKRAREVGIRKAIGSVRGQLIAQFYFESLFIAVLAFAVSLLLVLLCLPAFSTLANKNITIQWGSPVFWVINIAFTVFTGLIAGSYPALYLSSFNPAKVLKGPFRVGRYAAAPRKILVAAQFTISAILIIGTIVVFRQIQYAKGRPVGYSRNNLVNITLQTDDINKQFSSFKNDLLKGGFVTGVAESENQVTQINTQNGGFGWRGKNPAMQEQFTTMAITSGFGKTIGWQIVEGRDFDPAFLTDSSGFVVNEAAVKFMGLKHPVGETITWNDNLYKVIGVVKNMVNQSPYQAAVPVFFYLPKFGPLYVMNIKINPQVSAHDAINKIAATFKKYDPATPFAYQFVDDDYAKQFDNEERIGKLASGFAALAIFISCLGLFGMASFMAEQRTKEIGVRKIMGASVFTLWRMLSKDFLRLVAISLLIAIPTSYYFMHNWLQNYQYRTKLEWWLFAATAMGVILVTLATVSYQSIKAALANPVKSLRSE